MRVIHVLRKPLSEGTVASNTLKHGTGGLNIDASRITGDGSHMRADPLRKQHDLAGGDRDTKGAGMFAEGSTFVPTNHPAGRWPANVILQHLDGCRCGGTKKIRSSSGSPQTQEAYPKAAKGITLEGSADATLNQLRSSGYRNPDGNETVANWVCVEGCPVGALDDQTSTLQSGCRPNRVIGQPTQFGQKGTLYSKGFGGQLSATYDDKGGGASRFFKQVGGKKDG